MKLQIQLFEFALHLKCWQCLVYSNWGFPGPSVLVMNIWSTGQTLLLKDNSKLRKVDRFCFACPNNMIYNDEKSVKDLNTAVKMLNEGTCTQYMCHGFVFMDFFVDILGFWFSFFLRFCFFPPQSPTHLPWIGLVSPSLLPTWSPVPHPLISSVFQFCVHACWLLC